MGGRMQGATDRKYSPVVSIIPEDSCDNDPGVLSIHLRGHLHGGVAGDSAHIRLS